MPSTIEQRLESVEQTLAEVQQKVDSLENGTRQLKWWERIGRARSSEELVEFDEFLYGFDEFGIDGYLLFSSLFSQKSQKCIDMFDSRDIDPE